MICTGTHFLTRTILTTSSELGDIVPQLMRTARSGEEHKFIVEPVNHILKVNKYDGDPSKELCFFQSKPGECLTITINDRTVRHFKSVSSAAAFVFHFVRNYAYTHCIATEPNDTAGQLTRALTRDMQTQQAVLCMNDKNTCCVRMVTGGYEVHYEDDFCYTINDVRTIEAAADLIAEMSGQG